jgi:hypothetical protein
VTGRVRLAGGAATALVTAAALTSCATLPTSGSVQLSTLHGSGNSGSSGIQVIPVQPGPGWSPSEIVRGFLAASAYASVNASIAKAYLTTTYAKRWRPGSAATVIMDPQVTKASSPPRLITGGPPGATIDVKSRGLTTENVAGNLVVSPGPHVFTFVLSLYRGNYRISGISVNNKSVSTHLLLLTQPDFGRVYQPRDLYYFPDGQPAQALIPEPVFVPQQATGTVTRMVRSLLSAPLPSSWLSGAATTAFPKGTSLLGVRVIGGVRAVVDLGGAATKTSIAQRQRMAAQLYWSLTSAPYGASGTNQIRSVVLQFNHRTWKEMLPPFDPSWVPRGEAGPLYYQTLSNSDVPGVRVVSQSGQASLTVPATLGSGLFSAVAVTPGPTSEAVLAACRGDKVYLIPQWKGTRVITERLPSACTALSWDMNGNLWVAAGRSGYELVAAGRGSPVAPKLVAVYCPTLQDLPHPATITSLRVAPDGVRVAMVVRYHSGVTSVLAGAISKTDFTYFGQAEMVQVGSDITDPTAVTWLDPDHLLVLGQAGGRSELFEVPLNGGSSTEVSVPRGVTSIAANWPSSAELPRVVVAVAGTNDQAGSIWTSKAGLLNRGWSPMARGSTPVFPG